MNFLTFLSKRLFLIQAFIFLGLTYSYSASPGDSIKPISRIDKQFLVVAHVVYDKDTNAGIDEVTIAANIAAANIYFAPIGASFSLCEVRYIYNYQYDTINNDTRSNMLSEYWVANRINIFYVSNFAGDECGNADLGGITFTSKVGIVLKKTAGCQSPLVYAHELGHYFSLPHTFETKNGLELVDGSNCSTAGDGICDTPADPGNDADNVDANCIYTFMGKDANGDYYEPDISNVMSYYPGNCVCRFTNGQFNQMANYYLSNPIEW